MNICLSQFRSSSNVETNLQRHREVIERAAAHSCEFVMFPELSLTGYEPECAKWQAVDADDALFEPLAADALRFNLTIAVGIPLRVQAGIAIGLKILRANGTRLTYAKQLLHVDEEPFFVPGHRPLEIEVGTHRIAPAICYEAMQPEHGHAAIARGATVYGASVAKDVAGMHAARKYLSEFASRQAVPVLLVNAVGHNDGFDSGGLSTAYDAKGEVIGSLGSDEGELVVSI